MRELKFRVWDKLQKCYIYPDHGYQGHYTLSLNGKFYNLQNGSGGDEYVVEQYTGLKDKNGREIYDGDILKEEYQDFYEILDANGKFTKWSDDEKLFYILYKVKFIIGEYPINCEEYTIGISGWVVEKVFGSEDPSSAEIGNIGSLCVAIKEPNFGAYGFDSSKMIISGNIHENPELVNAKI